MRAHRTIQELPGQIDAIRYAIYRLRKLTAYGWLKDNASSAIQMLQEGKPIEIVLGLHAETRNAEPVIAVLQAANMLQAQETIGLGESRMSGPRHAIAIFSDGCFRGFIEFPEEEVARAFAGGLNFLSGQSRVAQVTAYVLPEELENAEDREPARAVSAMRQALRASQMEISRSSLLRSSVELKMLLNRLTGMGLAVSLEQCAEDGRSPAIAEPPYHWHLEISDPGGLRASYNRASLAEVVEAARQDPWFRIEQEPGEEA